MPLRTRWTRISGEFYVATFFTLENLRALMQKNRRTGECLGGLYLWASDMIIVERLTMDAVSRTGADLLASGRVPFRVLGAVLAAAGGGAVTRGRAARAHRAIVHALGLAR